MDLDISVKLSELYYKNVLVGYRITLHLFDTTYRYDVDVSMEPIIVSWKKKVNALQIPLEEGKGLIGTFDARKDMLIFGHPDGKCVETEAELKEILKDFLGVSKKYILSDVSLRSFISELLQGFSYPKGEDIRYDSSNLEVSVRFLGGYNAWDDGSEDICDSESFNRKVATALNKCIQSYNKKHKTNVMYQTSEKAWTYISFRY